MSGTTLIPGLFLYGGIAGMAASLWGLYVNHCTLKERQRILATISSFARRDIACGFNWRLRYHAFEMVTYEQHMWWLFLLRDPMTLYPMWLQEAMLMRQPETTRG